MFRTRCPSVGFCESDLCCARLPRDVHLLEGPRPIGGRSDAGIFSGSDGRGCVANEADVVSDQAVVRAGFNGFVTETMAIIL